MALLSVVMYLYDLMQVVNGLGWMPYGFAMLIMIVFSLYKFYTLFPRHERSSADQPQRGTSKKRFSKEDGGEGTKRQATA